MDDATPSKPDTDRAYRTEQPPAGPARGPDAPGVGAPLAGLRPALRRLAQRIARVLDLPRNGIGMIPAVHAVGAAAKAVGHPALPAECGALLDALERSSGRDAAFDLALLLEGHRDHAMAAVLVHPDAFAVTSAADRHAAHAMQRLLVYAVERQIELAAVGPQLRALQRGTAPLARSLREALGGAPGALPAWAETAVSGPWRRLARLLHEARVAPLSAPVVQPRAPAEDRSPPKFRPFVIQKLVSTRARNVYHQAGLASFDQSLAPIHFERLAPVLRAVLVDDDGQHFAAAVYFAMLFGLYPRQFDRVSFEPEPDGLQIDLARGVVRFSLRSVARRAEREDVDIVAECPYEFVDVPLDRMLFDWLQEQRSLRPTAARLSDLFDAANPDWMARFEGFVHAASGTSRTITIARLIHGAPRMAVAGGVDAVYAEMLFCIAGLVPRAMAHYVTICPNRLVAAAERMFPLLGLSGSLAGRPTRAASVYLTPTDAAAQALVKQSLGTVGKAVAVLAPSTTVRDLALCLNAAALGVLSAMVFLTGHRGQRIETIARAAFSLEQGIWYVLDKRDGSVRAVPLVPLLVASVRAYEALVRSFAYRVREGDPRLAQRLLQRLDPWSTEPYFFRLDDVDLKPLRSEDLRPVFEAHGLRLNDGRRWLSVVLRDAGAGCHVENAVAGRTFRGQFLYSSSTALTPFTVLQATRAALLARCAGWDVPAPRILAGRGNVPARPAPSTVLVPEREPLRRRRPGQERCALRLGDGYRLTRYFKAKATFECSPPAEPWIAFVFELIFAGGVSHSAELLAALDAALERRVAVDTERVTIATRTAELGLRQVVLSPLHASLIARLPRELPLRPVVVDRLDAAAAGMLGSTTVGALRALLDAARAAHALVLAPPLRDSAAGFIAPPVGAVRPASNWDNQHSS